MSYNPADNKAIEDEAKAMAKPDLEKYYVKDRNKRYARCGEVIGIAIIIAMFITFLVFIGFTGGEDMVKSEVSDNIEEISEDICPILGSGYISDNLFKSESYTAKIICNEANSGSF